MASPFLGDSSVGIPQPSITTRRPQQHHDQPSQLEIYQDVAGDERVVWATGRTQAGLVVGSHDVYGGLIDFGFGGEDGVEIYFWTMKAARQGSQLRGRKKSQKMHDPAAPVDRTC